MNLHNNAVLFPHAKTLVIARTPEVPLDPNIKENNSRIYFKVLDRKLKISFVLFYFAWTTQTLLYLGLAVGK